MAELGRYCKAYRLEELSAFAAWPEAFEKGSGADPSPSHVDDAPPESPGERYVFLHEDYVVTGGIFKDRDVIFDAVTPEWITFCKAQLGFRVPDDVPVET